MVALIWINNEAEQESKTRERMLVVVSGTRVQKKIWCTACCAAEAGNGIQTGNGKSLEGLVLFNSLSAALIKATIVHFKHQAICYNSYNCLSDAKI